VSSAVERAEALRALHAPDGEPLVLVNVWDAVSARVVAAQPGCRALATASWSVAAAHGYPDGEALPPDLVFTAIGVIADATDLPLTADLEAGYDMVGEAVGLALEAGAVGCNLEDGTRDPAAPLRPLDEAREAVAQAVAAGAEAGVPVVVNARTDAYLAAVDDAFAVAVERGLAFLSAGADCVFVPGVTDAEVIGALVEAIGPVSVLATPASPSLEALGALGVRRVSFGPGPLGVATAALGEAAGQLLARGAYPPQLAYRPPGGEAPQTRNERWQRARMALGVFAEEWELPLQPEDLDEMAYAVIRHLNNRGSFGDVDAAVRKQIEGLGRPYGRGSGNGNGKG
jgi:2-methylisocitrate lyase-like PEP mutase family enzyme